MLLSVAHVLDFLDTTKQAQDLGNAFGSIVRLHDDGRVPADNPFVGVSRAAPEIHSFGHRNVQGLALRPGSNQVWAVEHGPRGGDELNLIEPGRNYGWPLATYGVDYDGSPVSERRELPGTGGPLWYWVPSIAPSSLAFYDGAAFPA